MRFRIYMRERRGKVAVLLAVQKQHRPQIGGTTRVIVEDGGCNFNFNFSQVAF